MVDTRAEPDVRCETRDVRLSSVRLIFDNKRQLVDTGRNATVRERAETGLLGSVPVSACADPSITPPACAGGSDPFDVSICSRAQRRLCMNCNTIVTCFGHTRVPIGHKRTQKDTFFRKA